MRDVRHSALPKRTFAEDPRLVGLGHCADAVNFEGQLFPKLACNQCGRPVNRCC
jgi:hypothetical protein